MVIDVATEQNIYECKCALSTTPSKSSAKVVLGFDGYVDRLRQMLINRESATEYTTMTSMGDLSSRIQESLELKNSCSVEWITTNIRPGGHTANVGRAYTALGVTPTLVGTFGGEHNSLFEETFTEAQLLSVGLSSITDAIEFKDGKVMLTEIQDMSTLDWESLKQHIGIEKLVQILEGANLMSMGYWATIPNLPSIWEGLYTEVIPQLSDPPTTILIDPADLRRVSSNQIKNGIPKLARLDDNIPVTLSANKAETLHLGEILLGEIPHDLSNTAKRIRHRLGITNIISHTEDVSIFTTPSNAYECSSPYVANPAITTGVGDCFNAGFLYGRILNLSNEASLVLATVTANYYLRHGESPSPKELKVFVDNDINFQ